MPENDLEQFGQELIALLVEKTRDGSLQWQKHRYRASYRLEVTPAKSVSPQERVRLESGWFDIALRHISDCVLTMFDADGEYLDTLSKADSAEFAAPLEELYHLAKKQVKNRRAGRASAYLETLRNMVSNP